jgi:uncharacterized membrane protein YesL
VGERFPSAEFPEWSMTMFAENSFGRFFNRVGDVIWLNVLWTVFSIPLVTIGASTTAAYAVVFQWNDMDVGRNTHTFISAFRLNFKQSTITWMMSVAGLFAGMYMLRSAASLSGVSSQIMYAVSVFFLVILTVSSLLAFPIIAKFDVSIRQMTVDTLYLLIRQTWAVLAVVMTTAVGIYIALYIAPPVFAVLGGLLIYLNGVTLNQVFKKVLVNSGNM